MRFHVLSAIGFCLGFLTLSAQQSARPQWGGLRPGPYEVGYRTIRATDYARHYFPGAAGRPIQIYMWYPAQAAGAKPMSYGAYFDDIGYDWGKPEEAEKIRQYGIEEFKKGPLAPYFSAGFTASDWQKILQTPVPSIRNAPAAAGKFPVLLHLHSNGALAQSPLLEFLASHGYAVASISMIGTDPAYFGRGESGPHVLLSMAEDLAFVLAQLRAFDFADTDNAAVVGMIAQAGMSLQFKEMPLRAIACLDCSWDAASFRQLPYFDPKKIRIPILELINTEYNDQKITYLDSLPYAERFIGRFSAFSHASFYPFSKIAKPDDPESHKNYDLVAHYGLHFLNAVLKNDEAGRRFLSNDPEKNGAAPGFLNMRIETAQKARPTASEMLSWLRYGQLDKVRDAWDKGGKETLGKRDFWATCMFLCRDRAPHTGEALALYLDAFPSDPQIANLLNQWGYHLLGGGQNDEALQTFALFAQHFPQSPYAYDGLADAQMAAGDKAKAKINSEKVLALLDQANLQPAEKEALRKSAEDKLARIRKP